MELKAAEGIAGRRLERVQALPFAFYNSNKRRGQWPTFIIYYQ
jgi:hypothetical protein